MVGEVLTSKSRQHGPVPIQYAVGQATLAADQRVTFAVSSVDYGPWQLVAAGTPDSQIKVSHLNPKQEICDFLKARLLTPMLTSQS